MLPGTALANLSPSGDDDRLIAGVHAAATKVSPGAAPTWVLEVAQEAAPALTPCPLSHCGGRGDLRAEAGFLRITLVEYQVVEKLTLTSSRAAWSSTS